MQLPPIEPETVHLGCWLSWKDVWALVEPMSLHYWRRFKSLTISGREDLSQAASLVLLEYERDNGKPERIREVPAIAMVHRSIMAEIKSNRKQSIGGGLLDAPDRSQLTDKQVETLDLFSMHAAKAARRPFYEMTVLSRALGWSDAEISRYYQRKKDDRHYYSPETVAKMVKKGVQRIKRKMPPDVAMDVRFLQFLT